MPHQVTKNGVKNGNNRIFTSITFVSAIKLINTTLDTAEASLQSFQEKSKESHNREAKKCVRDVGKALRDIRHYTNIINKDIVPVYTKGSATSYIYKRIASSGAVPSHISQAMLAPTVTPTKKSSDRKLRISNLKLSCQILAKETHTLICKQWNGRAWRSMHCQLQKD